MINNFFESLFHKKWHLIPSKYPKDSEDNFSSKVLLPYQILQDLYSYKYKAPYVFEISHSDGVFRTACSVKDFSLEDDTIVVPSWMYEQLCLSDVDEVTLKYISVAKGKGITLLPHSVDFLEIENPKKELEKTLLNYHVLTYGDQILLKFDEIGCCRFEVSNVFPETEDSIYIVDTDLEVDFKEPIGFKEKIENEKSIMKYVKLDKNKGDIKSFSLSKIGYFTDWDSINAEE